MTLLQEIKVKTIFQDKYGLENLILMKMYCKEKYIAPVIDARKVSCFPVMNDSTVDVEVDNVTDGNESDDLGDHAKSLNGGFESTSFSTDW